jgi:hypothetical protein
MERFEYKGRNWLTLIIMIFFGILSIISFLFLIYARSTFSWNWWFPVLCASVGALFVIVIYGIRRALMLKRIIIDQDRLVVFRGKKTVLEARWDEITGLEYQAVGANSPSAIRVTMGKKHVFLTGELDISPLQIKKIHTIMERAWNEARDIVVEPEVVPASQRR